MTDDQAAELDDILVRWHAWADRQVMVRGYASVAAGFSLYRSAGHWDAEPDDELVERTLMHAVHRAIDAIEQPWRTAVHLQARNLVSGVDVWTSPRLPQDRAQREQLLDEARRMLLAGLQGEGMLARF